MDIDPKSWLEYGPLGAGVLAMFLNFAFFAWMVRFSFNMLEKLTGSTQKLLSKLEEAEKNVSEKVEKQS